MAKYLSLSLIELLIVSINCYSFIELSTDFFLVFRH